jgi:DHA1 family inner membrane transport protein
MSIIPHLRRVVTDYFKTLLADRTFCLFLLLIFLNGVVTAPFLPFLPVYVDEGLGLGQTFTADFRTISLLLMAAFVLLGGVVSDRLGPKRTMLLGLVGTPLAAAVFMIASPSLLLGLAVARGIAEGLLNGGGQTYLVASAPATRLSAATALYFLGHTLGSALGSPIGAAVLERGSFFDLGLIMLIAGAPILLAVMLLLSEAPGRAAKSLAVIDVLKGYLAIAGRRHVWTLALMQFLRTTFTGVATLAIPFLLHDLTGSKHVVGWFTSVSLVAGMLSMIVVGRISDRTGRRRIVGFCIIGTGLASAVLALCAGSAVGLFLCGTVAMTAAWTLSGQVTPLAKEMSEPGEEGRLVGMILFPWALGMLVGARIHGLMSQSQPGLMFGVTTLLLLAAWGLTRFMFRTMVDGAATERRGCSG